MADKNSKFTPREPDYRGVIEVPVWKNKTREGKLYLSMKIFGTTVNIFKNEPKPKKIEEEDV